MIDMKNKNKYLLYYKIVACVLIAILISSGVRALQIYIPQYNAAHNFKNIKKAAGINNLKAKDINKKNAKKSDKGLIELYKKNNDFVGWLSIENTLIDYPVMKSDDSNPEFYLNHSFDKKASESGTLFIGENCDANSNIFVIYGHNMNADTMFGTLDNYSDSVYAREHRNIVFSKPYERQVYRVFAAFKTKIYNKETNEFEYYKNVGNLNSKEYNEVLENYRNMSIISFNELPKYPKQIMLLSTCAYHTSEGRFVIAAYRIV